MKLRCPKPRTPLDSRDLEGDKTQEWPVRASVRTRLVKGYTQIRFKAGVGSNRYGIQS